MVTRWLAWIQMFDFDVRHVPGKKNVVADALSRKPTGPIADEDGELDDWCGSHRATVPPHLPAKIAMPHLMEHTASNHSRLPDGS
ncbi:hypothetical protein M433DRAFT_10690 [Acidomyces richmondensis BFW]|nr:hypothetical protein M433DRAFT_10690 [Acidomyces richmondensis BFW]